MSKAEQRPLLQHRANLGRRTPPFLGRPLRARAVLDDDQGVAGLFKNGHELKDCESSADLQVPEPAIQLAEDRGVVPADVEDLESL